MPSSDTYPAAQTPHLNNRAQLCKMPLRAGSPEGIKNHQHNARLKALLKQSVPWNCHKAERGSIQRRISRDRLKVSCVCVRPFCRHVCHDSIQGQPRTMHVPACPHPLIEVVRCCGSGPSQKWPWRLFVLPLLQTLETVLDCKASTSRNLRSAGSQNVSPSQTSRKFQGLQVMHYILWQQSYQVY